MTDILIYKNNVIPIKIAITPEEHEIGLMFQVEAFPMAFPYKTAAVHQFWMKNTLAPLDLVFCKSNKIVNIAQGKPFSLDLIGKNIVSDLILEFPLGTAQKLGMKVQDSVQLKYCIKTLAAEFTYSLES